MRAARTSAAAGAPGALLDLAARDRLFWPIASGILGATALVALRARMTPDVAWYLHAAGAALDGARLYADVLEINPPLVIWLGVPFVAAARALGVSDLLAFRVGVLALVAASAALCAWMLRAPLGLGRAERRWWLLALLFVLGPLTRDDFGQREHLLLALAAPYLLACAARAEGRRVPTAIAVLAGAMAGLGMSLKPHFGLVWAGLEAWLWLGTGDPGRARATWRRPEAVAAAAVPPLYGLAVLLATPHYLDMLRLVAGSYAGYLSNSPTDILAREPGAWLALFGLFAFAGLQRECAPRERAVARALAVAAGALLVAALLQRKGWRYHLYPSFGCAALLLATLLLGRRGRRGALLAERVYAVAAALVLAGLVVSTGAAAARQALHPRDRRYEPYPEFPELLALVRERARGDRVVVFSNNLRAAFPLVNYADVGWGLRFNSLWIFGGAYAEFLTRPGPIPYRTPSAMGPAERFMNDAVAEDLERSRPRLVIAQRPDPDNLRNPIRRLDYMGYLRRDPRIAAAMAGYRRLPDVGDYEVYERVGR